MRDWVTDWWGAELACWFIAVLSLIAIVIVLESHKSQPVPEWPFQITINSLISIFAMTGQMAMMKLVVECISQLKWLWFIRKQKLADLQAFDDASRGPTGSLILLGKIRGFHLVTLGAAVVVLSIAFGTFAQQVVTYPLRPHPTENATAPLVFNYTLIPIVDTETSPKVFAAMYNGLSYNYSTLSDITPSCGTGNCLLEQGLLEVENPAFSEGAGGFTIFRNLITLPIDGFEIAVTTDGVGILSSSIQDFLTDDCYKAIDGPSLEPFPQNSNDEFCLTLVGNIFLESVQSPNPLSAVEKAIQNLATSLTNRAGSGGEAQIAQFQGTAFTPQAYVGTNYTWLIFPVSLVLLTFVLLLATISKSQRLGSRVWKSSNMAILQGLHGDLHKNVGGLTSISEMDEKGKGIQARFNMESGKVEYA